VFDKAKNSLIPFVLAISLWYRSTTQKERLKMKKGQTFVVLISGFNALFLASAATFAGVNQQPDGVITSLTLLAAFSGLIAFFTAIND